MRRKISRLQFACFRARSCRSLTKSSAHVCGRGAEISSPTRLLFSAKVNQDCPHVHHDALEFPDGELVLLTYLMEGQEATVLQLPADAVGSKAQQRAAYV